MSVFDLLNPTHEGLDPKQARLLRGVSDEFLSFYGKKELGELAYEKFTGDDTKSIDREAKKLDNMLKKKQLGIGLNDEDYEDFVNQSSSNPLTIASASMTMMKTRPSLFSPEEYLPEGIPYLSKLMGSPQGPGADLLKLPMKNGGVLKDSINVIQGRIANGKRAGKLTGLLRYFK